MLHATFGFEIHCHAAAHERLDFVLQQLGRRASLDALR
jgi:hypothetical protein